MIVFPNCKINLGLNIIRKRSDDFHDIATVFHPLPFYDALEIIQSADENEITFTSTGISIDGDNENNLCIKAYRLLKKEHLGLPSIRMHLHKTIPAGAGLGGGSADGTFTLKVLHNKFLSGLATSEVFNYSRQLGSDCPFFMFNKSCFASGTGEILEPVNIDFGTYKFVLVSPGIHIHTANAFSQVTPALPVKSVKEIIQQPVTTWKNELKNDFEDSVFRQYPEIKKIKDELYDAGAFYASMSGSGSTVYGIFKKEKKVQLSFPSDYFVRECLNL